MSICRPSATSQRFEDRQAETQNFWVQEAESTQSPQSEWDEVICEEQDHASSSCDSEDDLADFDWRAELKLLEQENRAAEVR